MQRIFPWEKCPCGVTVAHDFPKVADMVRFHAGVSYNFFTEKIKTKIFEQSKKTFHIRVTQENIRVTQENIRVTQENIRVTQENIRAKRETKKLPHSSEARNPHINHIN